MFSMRYMRYMQCAASTEKCQVACMLRVVGTWRSVVLCGLHAIGAHFDVLYKVYWQNPFYSEF